MLAIFFANKTQQYYKTVFIFQYHESLPTFGTQSFALGTLPDPSLFYLVCVSAARSHTRPMIGHYVVVCNIRKTQSLFQGRSTGRQFFLNHE